MIGSEARTGTARSPGAKLTSTTALMTLTFVTFVVGTAELVVVGILDRLAAGTGVSISTAGGLVTAYALGIAVGAPILSALTGRFGKRGVLRASLVVFLAGNVLAAAATSFGLLLAVRLLTGSLHGLVAGLATAIAAGLVVPSRRGQAIALVVGGITVSTIVGVPIGTLIGQAMGWQTAFLAIVALGVLALAATLLFVPQTGTRRDEAGTGGQTRAAFAPRVLALLVVGLLLFGAQFIAFTYLNPFLQEVAGVSDGLISVFLLAYGIAATAGTLLGGRAADRSAPATLLVANIALAVALGALYLVGANPVLAALALGAWGLAGFAIPPALLLRAMTLAGPGAGQAATLGISAFNAGIAAGSVVGGAVFAAYGPRATVLAALIVVAVTVPATWATRWLAPAPADEPSTQPSRQA